MRILNICAYTWAIGGPARIIYDHSVVALQAGHEVSILSPMDANEAPYTIPEGARLIRCNRTKPISLVYREFSLDLFFYLLHNHQHYDIIHIHGIWHFGCLAPFLLPIKAKKVITIHGLLDRWAIHHHKWKKDLVSFLYQKRILRKVDLIQINNEDERADLNHYLGYEHPRVVKIPNGMDLRFAENMPIKGAFRKKFNFATDIPLVLFMGRLNIKKGLDLLLPAFASFLKNNPAQEAILVLAGPDDGYQQACEQFIQAQALASRIVLVGMLTGEDKASALVDADVFVLPSYSEGFSIAVLEAMTAQVPTLVSGRVGFDEYIEKNDAAFVCELTSQSIEKGFSLLLSDKTAADNYVANAYRMVLENFDIRKVASCLLAAYSISKV